MRKLFSDRISRFIVAIMLVAALLLAVLIYNQYGHAKPSVKIGVLHSLTGTMAMSETPLVDAVRLAVEEANQSGGVNGHPIKMVVADCRSDAAYCAQQAERLITQDSVQALFGCWTSDCRKAVKRIVEKHHHLLFYPLPYEGLEQSSDIIYTGTVPNQQIVPMALWALQDRGERFFLIGSDYTFSRTANRMVKDVLFAQGGRMSGERYVPLGTTDMATVVQEIVAQHPDFVLNTLNGDSNLHFFHALRAAGISAEKMPVFSASIAEAELAAIGADLVAGHYAAWSYFQSVDSEENRAFITRFRKRFGKERVLDDPMEASYIGVRLWVDSVRTAGVADLMPVKNILAQQSMSAPQGIVAVEFSNGHLWKAVRIGRVRADGQFDILWQSEAAVRPVPFPSYRSHSEWFAEQQLLPGAVR